MPKRVDSFVPLNFLVPRMEEQRYSLLSSSCLLFYDYLLTLDDEVNLVWNHRQSTVTVLFLVSRYATLLFSIFDLLSTIYSCLSNVVNLCDCQAYIKSLYPVIAPLIIFSLASWILILRTYALYSLNKTVLISLAVLWTLTSGTMILAGTTFGQRTHMPDSLIATSRLCLLGRVADAPSSVFWAVPLVLDTAVFSLTLRKTGMYAHSGKSRNRLKPVDLARVFMRDGTVYYAVVCKTHLLNCLITLFAPDGVKVLGGSLSQKLSTMLVYRLVLSLRKENERRSRLRTFTAGTDTSPRGPEGHTTWSDGTVLSTCAIASFFHIELETHEIYQDPPSELINENVEQDVPSSENEPVGLDIVENRSDPVMV